MPGFVPHRDSQHSGGFGLAQEPSYDPMASFGQVRQPSNKKNVLMIAIGGAVVAAIAVVAVVVLTGEKEKTADVVVAPPDKPPPGPADPNTGFDLYVTPPGLIQWKLDGEARTDRLPSRIRSITPGSHTIQIDPPPGFLSQSQQITVEQGKAPKVDIVLQPIQGIVGVFDTTPTGSTVSLIVDGKRELLGTSPQRKPLDPRYSYNVLFEKQGYVSVNKPVTFSGQLEEKMVIPLEATVATAPDPKKPDVKLPDPKKPDPKVVGVVPDPKKPDPKLPDPKKPDPKLPDPKPPDPKPPDPKVVAVPKGTGTLTIGSKPPCEIYVDGANTGLHTPQSSMTLPAGTHRITLINNEFGINDKFTITIKPDVTEKVIKNYSHLLPK
jgi:hypothetical protein